MSEVSPAVTPSAPLAPSAPSAELFPKPVVKGGITFGAVSAVLNFLGIIPVLGFFFGLLNWLVGIMAGYTVVYATNGKKENLGDVIKNSVVTGVIAGLISGVASGLASIVNGLFISRISFFGVYYTPGLADFISWFFGALVWSVVGMVIWSVIGGIIVVYYEPSKLPESLRVQIDKLKVFVTK